LKGTEAAEQWYRTRGDRHGLLNALHVRHLLHERDGNGREAYRASLLLYDELRKLRATVDRSRSGRHCPRCSGWKSSTSAALPKGSANRGALFPRLEFRRGLSIAEPDILPAGKLPIQPIHLSHQTIWELIPTTLASLHSVRTTRSERLYTRPRGRLGLPGQTCHPGRSGSSPVVRIRLDGIRCFGLANPSPIRELDLRNSLD
jgi:hypothetical protein